VRPRIRTTLYTSDNLPDLRAGAILNKMTDKDKKIIADAEREGYPIFVLTAKDFYSTQAIAGYFKDCLLGGCKQPHLHGIADRVAEFKEWQDANPMKCKIPD